MANDYSADRIMRALATKHQQDVFVPECKNGPTQTGSHLRLDAWVLLKTWSPVTTIGYEVKVSRSDWRRDSKVQDYAGLCHLLYLVAPKGVIPLEEVPASWGVIEVCGPTDRLVTRRRAERREIELPASLMTYVLMCRTTIKGERPADTWDAKKWRRDELAKWVNESGERKELSYAVSKRIHETFDAQERRVRDTSERIKQLEHIERRIEELGFNPRENVSQWQVSDRLSKLSAIISPWLLTEIKTTVRNLERVHASLDELRAGPQSKEIPA